MVIIPGAGRKRQRRSPLASQLLLAHRIDIGFAAPGDLGRLIWIIIVRIARLKP